MKRLVFGYSFSLFSWKPRRLVYPGAGRQQGDPAVGHWRWLGFVAYWTIASFLLCVASACRAYPMPSVGPDDGDVSAMVETVYTLCKGELGPLARVNVLRDLVEVAQGFFEKPEDRLTFVLLVCIESRFDPSVRSSAGAVGLTQIIPKYAPEFASRCYLSTKGIDLYVPRVSLMTGACQFRYLINRYDSNYILALAAYNSGEESATVRKLRKLEKINQETAGYISRFSYLRSLYHSQGLRRGNVPSVAGAN